MGNSCNKVTPIVCTVRCSVTVPLWCQSSSAGKKVHPDVIEPKKKEEPAQTPQEVPVLDLPTPAAPPATASAEPPAPEPKPAPVLDPVEVFQSSTLVSPGPQSQREEPIAADAPTTSSSSDAQPATKGAETVEVTNVVSLEQDDTKSIAPEEPLGVQPIDDDDDVEAATAQKAADAEEDSVAKEDLERPIADGDDTTGPEDKAASQPSERDADDEEEEADEEEVEADGEGGADEEEGDSDEQGSQTLSDDESGVASQATASSEASDDEARPPFEFSSDGRAALERFCLLEDADVIATRRSGLAAADALQTICLDAMDTGAAAQNCELLMGQIGIVTHVLARAHQSGASKVIKPLLVQLHPILETVQLVVSDWKNKGTVEKFALGRAADDEFMDLHLQLKDFAQSDAFLKAFHSLADTDEAAAIATKQASQQLSGYGSVEASRAAFERLLLLFILRYKPTKTRTQKQRLMDLLAVYNDPSKAAAWGCKTMEDSIEHLAKTRLGRAATHAVPLMVVLMTNMWGASPDSVPRGRNDKWRMAVRMALEPLRVATGTCQLPVVPLDDVQEWEDSA